MDGGLTFFPQPWVVEVFGPVDVEAVVPSVDSLEVAVFVSFKTGAAKTTAVDESTPGVGVVIVAPSAAMTDAPIGILGAAGFAFCA